ncbi:hypothetical protein MIDIC_70061 [Alphaproteobacteria bacterium]
MQCISSISTIIPLYDLYIVDIYGVIFYEQHLINQAIEVIGLLKQLGKTAFFLSNFHKTNAYIKKMLIDIAVKDNNKYAQEVLKDIAIFTSCDFFIEFVIRYHTALNLSTNDAFLFLRGKAYVVGDTKHHLISEISMRLRNMGCKPFEVASSVKEADYLIMLAYSQPNDNMPMSRWDDVLHLAAEMSLPCLCPYPDVAPYHTKQKRIYTPGFYAQHYQQMNSCMVYNFGKPYKETYDFAISSLGVDVSSSKILVIGDSMVHDIAGANNIGADSLLIDKYAYSDTARLANSTNFPTYIMEILRV